MADKDFFGKAASFDDALRKFEEALRQSQAAARGQPLGQQPRQLNRNMPDQQGDPRPVQRPARQAPEQPPVSPASGRPSAPAGQPQPSGSGLAGEILRQLLGIPPDAGSWQGQGQQGAGPWQGQGSQGAGPWQGQGPPGAGSWQGQGQQDAGAWQGQEPWLDEEGTASEGLPEPIQPDSLTEGIGSGEGLDSSSSQDDVSGLSALTGLDGSTSLGSTLQTGSAWWEDAAPGSAASARSGTLPPALAHLGRYPNPLVQGVIWSEVLGRPVSKRRGRGRHGF